MKLKQKQLFQSKSLAQLQTDLITAKQELARLRLDLKANKLKDLHAVSKQRKTLALIKTLITQKTNHE